MPYFTHNGHRLFYREQGTGPLLLILPGNTASSVWLAGELDYFSTRYRAVALDFWGTGQSDRLGSFPLDWWEQGAHDAAALVDYLESQPALVMGTSGGAMVALLMAILHPAQVQAVIADSTVERFPPRWLSREIALGRKPNAGQVSFWQKAHGDDWPQIVEADSDLLLRFEQAGGDAFRGRLSQITCPVLLSASVRDEALPDVEPQVRGMAAQIKGSRLYLAQAGSHPLMWSRSAEFRREADKFLASGLRPA
jgi:valacyclovir hydrolase